MIAVLRNPTYAKLFSAQVLALLGTGLLTVALGLLAYDVASGNAGLVMGNAMTIKMVAYVAVAPVTSALTHRVARRPLLIGADLVRAAVALSLPFVTAPGHIYALIFLLQSASATFTPAFQAVIPSVLPDEAEYTRALSLSRLAYDLEALVSPMLAAALLTVMGYHNLFVGTAAGFLASASLVAACRLPRVAPAEASGFLDRLTRGTRIFWRTPQLRALMALNLVVATTTAMVIVNTAVLVRGNMGRTQSDVALMLAAYGAGSMLVALRIPTLVERAGDRRIMLTGAACLPPVLLVAAGLMAWTGEAAQWCGLLAAWFLLGAATSAILTPSARLLRRNSDERTRPAVFAAQFSLSHACFLVTYPLAGTLGARLGLAGAAAVLATIGVVGAALAFAAFSGSGRSANAPSSA
ncbi:MAG: MFS transporter [Actinomycetaceae bacterium]|nr:MFS transporter [Actinomycetaceae bacterium]